jgi:uncharacterized protein
MRHILSWFEIPVDDIDRAQRFYETLLGQSLRREEMGPQSLAVFPYDEGSVGGALLSSPHPPSPSSDGMVAYLNAGPSLDLVLSRADELGAEVLLPKVKLPRDIGWIAHIRDCEGNRVGLHSLNA